MVGKSNVISSEDLKDLILNGTDDERISAIRKIWTDYNNINDIQDLKEIAPTIFDLLKSDRESRNTWHYMISLGCLNYQPAKSFIFDILKNSNDEYIQGFAAESFSRFDSITLEIEAYLWNLISNMNSLVIRVNSIRAIANNYKETGNDDISNKLFSLLIKENNPAIRGALIMALGTISSKNSLKRLLELKINIKSDSELILIDQAIEKIDRYQI